MEVFTEVNAILQKVTNIELDLFWTVSVDLYRLGYVTVSYHSKSKLNVNKSKTPVLHFDLRQKADTLWQSIFLCEDPNRGICNCSYKKYYNHSVITENSR